MKKIIGNNWDLILKEEYEKDYFKSLLIFISNEYKDKEIYPKKENLFRALKETNFNDVKVVILGQDPYHGEGEANGLCFSVNENIKMPPSLRNIFKELKEDLSIDRNNTDLIDWSKQGVLLLNTILTVEKDKPLSHKDKGWEIFTDSIIKKINEKEPIIFVLWGNYARSKKELINTKKHYIIESVHPSPLSYSRGFKGSKPFSKINNILRDDNKKIIQW